MTHRGCMPKHERYCIDGTLPRSTVVGPSHPTTVDACGKVPAVPLQRGGPSSEPRLCHRLRCSSESEEATGHLVDPAFLVACRNSDDNRIRQLMTCRALTSDMVNCKDKTGKTGVSHICVNGNLPLLELITPIPALDVNIADNEGNTPLHFASQAGQVDVVHHLIGHFKNLQIDQRNHLGFTSLMKASLQGRTKCVKLLLSAGASPILRDHGRGLCANEWARFCGRQVCAEVLEKFLKNANCSQSSLRTKLQDLEKWNSEPNLQFLLSTETKDGWLRQKLKRAFKTSNGAKKYEYSLASNLTNVALCASSPLVPTASIQKSTPWSGTLASSAKCAGTSQSSERLALPKVHVTEEPISLRGSDSHARPKEIR